MLLYQGVHGYVIDHGPRFVTRPCLVHAAVPREIGAVWLVELAVRSGREARLSDGLDPPFGRRRRPSPWTISPFATTDLTIRAAIGWSLTGYSTLSCRPGSAWVITGLFGPY